MPHISAHGKLFRCDKGANLRQVLLQNHIPVHNGKAQVINCRGLGTCGTCAVQVVGLVSAPNQRERLRRSIPPHSPERDLRLACQTKVLDDIAVTKFAGFWGHKENVLWHP